ncbi:hypothetical protein LOC71_19170 [Rhodopirellula sp. JC740]|uniref:Transposase n=1 Tax=Rhodopirellula halodulae TaxID=2894198 RepID=A0ABS8NLE7_9BACT|nr:hypothetical protein [Rhodopirellula sp. JC740]MCC9644399.1 hypothetical protein [Rhodopirellula sp. JC740]
MSASLANNEGLISAIAVLAMQFPHAEVAQLTNAGVSATNASKPTLANSLARWFTVAGCVTDKIEMPNEVSQLCGEMLHRWLFEFVCRHLVRLNIGRLINRRQLKAESSENIIGGCFTHTETVTSHQCQMRDSRHPAFQRPRVLRGKSKASS